MVKSIKLNEDEVFLLEKKRLETGFTDSHIFKLALYEPCVDRQTVFAHVMKLSEKIDVFEKRYNINLDEMKQEVLNICLSLNL